MSTEYLTTRLEKLGFEGVAGKLKEMSLPRDKIPKFFSPSSKAINDIHESFLHATGLESFQSSYPSRLEIIEMKRAADQLVSTPALRFSSIGSKTISYGKYMQMRDRCPPNVQQFLTATLFTKINGGRSSPINYNDFFNYMKTIGYAVPHIKILMSYDVANSGVISIDGFRRYVEQMASGFYFVQEFTKRNSDHEFYSMYVDYVVSEIFVRLDTLNTGVININTLIESKAYQDFMMIDPDDDPEDELNKNNKFGPVLSNIMINSFIRICSSDSKLLCVDDIMQIQGLRWCRVFSESLISKAVPRPDFKWYVKAQEAYDNIGEPWANAFFFDVIDFNQDGVITEEDLALIYEEVSHEYVTYVNTHDIPLPSFQWIIAEMFDIYGISDATITKELFINRKETASFVRHFIDIRGFIKWEASIDILNPARSG